MLEGPNENEDLCNLLQLAIGRDTFRPMYDTGLGQYYVIFTENEDNARLTR